MLNAVKRVVCDIAVGAPNEPADGKPVGVFTDEAYDFVGNTLEFTASAHLQLLVLRLQGKRNPAEILRIAPVQPKRGRTDFHILQELGADILEQAFVREARWFGKHFAIEHGARPEELVIIAFITVTAATFGVVRVGGIRVLDCPTIRPDCRSKERLCEGRIDIREHAVCLGKRASKIESRRSGLA